MLHINKNLHILKNNPPRIKSVDLKERLVYYSELAQIFKLDELQTACENVQLTFVEAGEQIEMGKEQMIYVHKGELVETLLGD